MPFQSFSLVNSMGIYRKLEETLDNLQGIRKVLRLETTFDKKNYYKCLEN